MLWLHLSPRLNLFQPKSDALHPWWPAEWHESPTITNIMEEQRWELMSSVSFLVLFTTATSKGNFGGLPRKYCIIFRLFPFFPLCCLSHHIYRCFIKMTKKKHPLWNNSNTNIVAWDKVKGTSVGPIQGRKKYPRLLEEKDGSPKVVISTLPLHTVLNLVIHTNYFQLFFFFRHQILPLKIQVKPGEAL